MKKPKRSLVDVLNSGGGDNIRDAWNSTDAARDDGPIKRGEYVCHVVDGELANARTKSTPGYKLIFEVIEGEYKGRRVWHDIWLTAAALPRAKRDLKKLGVTDIEQLEEPLPRGIRCKVTVVVHTDDDGIDRNEVRRFEVLGIDELPPNPFPPQDHDDQGDSAGAPEAEPQSEIPT